MSSDDDEEGLRLIDGKGAHPKLESAARGWATPNFHRCSSKKAAVGCGLLLPLLVLGLLIQPTTASVNRSVISVFGSSVADGAYCGGNCSGHGPATPGVGGGARAAPVTVLPELLWHAPPLDTAV